MVTRDRDSYSSHFLMALIFLLCAVFIPRSFAQHGAHGMPASGNKQVISMPDNDEVLAVAPESVMLHFQSNVRLVKLVLKEPSQGKEPIDIGFRYRDGTGVHFVQPLPVLPDADYYFVEWAAFDANSNLIKGAFYFSFGENARPPSFYLDQMMHMDTFISPDYRLL